MWCEKKAEAKNRGLTALPEAAHLLRVSSRTVERLIAHEATPTPVHVGRRVFLLSHEFDRWLDLGCPNRPLWDLLWSGRGALAFRCSCGRRWSPPALWRCVRTFCDLSNAHPIPHADIRQDWLERQIG